MDFRALITSKLCLNEYTHLPDHLFANIYYTMFAIFDRLYIQTNRATNFGGRALVGGIVWKLRFRELHKPRRSNVCYLCIMLGFSVCGWWSLNSKLHIRDSIEVCERLAWIYLSHGHNAVLRIYRFGFRFWKCDVRFVEFKLRNKLIYLTFRARLYNDWLR